MQKNIILIIVLISTLWGCHSEKRASEKPYIVATTGMLYDAVISIGGDHISADAIMGSGVDPHLYKATQGDLKKFKDADLIIYNGLLLEGKMGTILEKLGRQKPVVAAAASIPADQLLYADGYEDAYDPHVWFDVRKWKMVVQTISESLIELDSIHQKTYQNNTRTYLAQLDSLDLYVRQKISQIPEEQRILITAHDAFAYFGHAYNIRVEGLQGISTVADFGLKDVANLIDIIIDNNIQAIFVETSVSDKSIQAVVNGCQEKGHAVKIGGHLYSDAMGKYGTPEGTYLGMVKSNVETIVEALK